MILGTVLAMMTIVVVCTTAVLFSGVVRRVVWCRTESAVLRSRSLGRGSGEAVEASGRGGCRLLLGEALVRLLREPGRFLRSYMAKAAKLLVRGRRLRRCNGVSRVRKLGVL